MATHSLALSRTSAEVLLVCPNHSEFDSLSDILNDCWYRLFHVYSYKEAVSFLCKHHVEVVICSCDLPDGTWKDLLEQSSRLSSAPNLVVTSRLADERLWADVLTTGGYDLLLVPFESDEAIRVIAQAWLDWTKKNTVNDHNAAVTRLPVA